MAMVLNIRPENLREGLGEKEEIFRLAKHEVGRNNSKHIECCKVFSGCTIGKILHIESQCLRVSG